MDNRDLVRDFLMSRRARLTPGDVGLPDIGERRVPGLRRSEVAQLAGLSVEYYSRLERGAIAPASVEVLDALGRALRLDSSERAHLERLADSARATKKPRERRSTQADWTLRPSMRWTLESMTTVVAMVGNGRTDLLAANKLGRALYDEMIAAAAGARPKFARYTFLDPGSRRLYADWEGMADANVAMLRTEAGRNPHSKPLHDLVGELSTLNAEFRTRWGSHDVRPYTTGMKTFRHHVVGDMTLAFEALDLAANPGATLTALSAEPGSPSGDALRMLASWACSEDFRSPDTALHFAQANADVQRSGSGPALQGPG